MGGYVPRGSIDSVGPPPGAFNATTVPPLNPDPRLVLAFGGGRIVTLEQARYALTHPYTRTRVGC